MKMSKVLLIGLVGASLSVSAIAESIKDKLIDVSFVEPAKVVQLKAFPELTTQPSEALTVFIHDVYINSARLITDYGGIEERQVNSNKLAYRESNVLVANFAKMQNQNFERMRLAF